MIGLCFYAEAREACGRQIRTDRWEYMAEAFGVTDLIAIDRTSFECFRFEAGETAASVETVIAQHPEARRVFIEKDAPLKPIPLTSFAHPPDPVIYFVGSDSAGFRHVAGLKTIDAEWVSIPTVNRCSLWAEQAALLVLGHRWMNGGR